MNNFSYGQVAILSAVLVLGCASCGAASGPNQFPSQTSTSSTPNEASTRCQQAQALDCATYTSISGKDAAMKDLPWIAAQPLSLSISTMNGITTLVMRTPCNTLNVPVTVTDTLITPDPNGIASGAKGCLGADGEHEAWARQFLSHPITYSHTDAAYTFKNMIGTIEFRKSSSSS
jgi:hypothetical protein